MHSHSMTASCLDDVMKWKYFPRYWPFVRGTHRSMVSSRHRGQWRDGLVFSLICVWINGWVNNREAGDLRRHRAHHDVTVMWVCMHIREHIVAYLHRVLYNDVYWIATFFACMWPWFLLLQDKRYSVVTRGYKVATITKNKRLAIRTPHISTNISIQGMHVQIYEAL